MVVSMMTKWRMTLSPHQDATYHWVGLSDHLACPSDQLQVEPDWNHQSACWAPIVLVWYRRPTAPQIEEVLIAHLHLHLPFSHAGAWGCIFQGLVQLRLQLQQEQQIQALMYEQEARKV